jgi:excisionase family DNA binding protein
MTKRTAIALEDFFTPKQAARLLGIHEKSIFRWLRDGKITVVLIGGQRYITAGEIRRLKEENQVNKKG